MSSKSDNPLAQYLMKFFSNNQNLKQFLDVVNKNTEYSLRILEWFISNYSKKFNIVYQIYNSDTKKREEFNVYLSYRSQLKAFKKKSFDPFKRYQKFNLMYKADSNSDKVTAIKTTIGQLNFFRWALENNILKYVNNNLQRIKADMNASINPAANKSDTKVKPSTSTITSTVTETKMINGIPVLKTRKKRQSLSVAATRTTIKRYSKTTLVFE